MLNPLLYLLYLHSCHHFVHDRTTIAKITCVGDGFQVLCEAITTWVPELGEDIDDGTWTVFVPTNRAFKDIEVVLTSLSDEQVFRILKFHAAKNQVLMYDNLECTETIEMASCDNSRTKYVNNEDDIWKSIKRTYVTTNWVLCPKSSTMISKHAIASSTYLIW